MILFKIYLFSAIMLFGYQHSENKIEVVGKALNAKAGAVVVGVNEIPYYLEGIKRWDKKFYGKKVKVSGILLTENLPKRSHGKLQVQEITGTKRTIQKPKWELVE
ncbi:MAG: hypothetical protein ACTHJ8_02800 [Mucilaginibacter sp.]